MSETNDKKYWLEHVLTRVAAVVASLVTIFGTAFVSINYLSQTQVSSDITRMILSGTNIVVLFIFVWLLRKTKNLEFKEVDNEDNKKQLKYWAVSKYWDVLNVEVKEGEVEVNGEGKDCIDVAKFNEKRVNMLVKQYKSNILWFMYFLIPLYFIFLVDNKIVLPNNYESYHPFLKVAEDILNLTNSIFIFLGFMVLYNKTIDEKNEEFSYQSPIIIPSAIFIGVYLVFLIYFRSGITTKEPIITIWANTIQLFIGSLNGLTMALLFGRYVSMEQSVRSLNSGKLYEFIRWGTIFILPVYALAQPLFGNFEIEAFGSPQFFGNCVIFVCLIGKAFFLFVTYWFISKKWMHMYLHLILAKYGIPKDFPSCFKI